VAKQTQQKNPFIVGGPVPPKRFIGRKKEAKTILDRLASSAPGSTAISGERRIGKTSLLHYIRDPQVAEKWDLSPERCAFVFIDSHTIVPFKSDGFWRYILRSLVTQEVYDPVYIESLFKDKRRKVKPFELGELFDRIAQEGRLVVLLLDEFEHVVKHVRPNNPELLYLLRALINRPMHGLALVLASSKPLDTLLHDFRFSGSPFPTSFIALSVGPFSQAEADELFETYTRGTGIRFGKKDKERIYEACKGHPHRLQSECHKLFEERAKRRWFQLRKPTIHGPSKALINIGLVFSAILLVLVSTLWYKYVYPETIGGTQTTPYGISYSVRYPEWIGVGDTEQFRISLTNEGTQSLNNVRIYLDFSDAVPVAPPPGCSLTADVGSLPVRNTWGDKIEFCAERVNGTDIVQTDLFIASDELGEKLLNTYAFKVIHIPYIEDFRSPKTLIRWFLGGVGALAGAFLTALVVSLSKIVSSREEG
jgi:hypothetical protein